VPEILLIIHPYKTEDEAALVTLWQMCSLIVPWNYLHKDIARKLQVQPKLFLVRYTQTQSIDSVIGVYDGHSGWINYLAVRPDFLDRSYGE